MNLNPLFPFILITLLSHCNALTQTSSKITDLISTSSIASLDNEATSWTVSNEVCPGCARSSSLLSSCYSLTTAQTIFGGPNILGPDGQSSLGEYFEGLFSLGTNTFNSLAFSFQLWVVSTGTITSFNVNNVVDFSVNGVNFDLVSGDYTTSSCSVNYTLNGGAITVTNYKHYLLDVEHIFPFNSASTVAFRITSKLNVPSTTTSFGLRRLYIYLMDTPNHGTKNFPCDISYYWDGTTCSPCHPFCTTCSGPTNNQCSSCLYPNYNYFNQTCLDYCPTTGPLDSSSSFSTYNYCRFKCGSGFYWAYNDSCTPTCSLPLVKTNGNSANNNVDTCASPCPTQYFYPNGTCNIACGGLWESVIEAAINVQYCKNPCGTVNFMYPDGTCENHCQSPLLNRTEPGMKFCFTPCAPGDFLYANSSCSASCETPLLQETDSKNFLYCKNPCNSTAFLYPDGTCNSACAAPLVSRTEPGVMFCFTPCAPSDYLYANSSCFASCDPPLLQYTDSQNFQYCKNPCNPTELLYPNGSCSSTCAAPLVSRTEPGVMFCFTPCDSGDYLYPNSSCFAACDSPLLQVADIGFLYCTNPCNSTAFLYPDGSCNSTCPSPLLSRTEPGVMFCFTPCAPGDYLYPNSSCFSACDSPLLQVAESGFLYCTNPCNSSAFLYPDGSCNSTCASPLVSRTEPDFKYCFTPCDIDKYLFPNGSCLAACDMPWVQMEEPDKNFKFCTNPCDPLGATPYLNPDSSCNDTCASPLLSRSEPDAIYCFTPCLGNQYLYVDGSCETVCKAPLISREEPNTFKFCVNPCQPANSLFLFPDSSCNQTCSLPLFERIEPDVKYCYNPCSSNNTFLHENIQICQTTCPYPSIAKNELYGKYCSFPCEDHSHYFHMLEKRCEKTCEYPHKATESPLPKLCSSSLSDEDIKQVEQMTSAADTASSASNTATLIWSLINSGDSTAVCMGPLTKMLQYLKFMDIVFPEKVQLMLLEQTKKANKKGFTQKMMGSELDKFPNHELTGRFLIYPIKSSFFVNFWPSFFNLSVILLVTGLVMSGIYFTKGNVKVNGILKSLSEVLKWNVFLVTFCGTIGDIVLYTALEFQAMQFENTQEVISFIVCLGINALVVIVVVKILDVNSALRRAKQDNLDEEQKKVIEKEWSSYKALFECYKDYSFYQQIFLFVFIMRSAIFNATIGYLYNYPLLQATVSLVMNILMLGYLVIKRPMKKMVNLIQQIVLEFALLPFNACVLALGIMDSKEIVEVDRRKAIGNVMVYINVMVPILSVVLMAAKFIVMAVDFYKTWKMSKKSKGLAIQNKPKSFESLRNKNLTTTDNNNITTLDLTDNSMMMMMSPEMNMIRSQSRVIDSPVNPRIRHSRPQIDNMNFLTPNNQSMVRNFSMPSDHGNSFPQQQSQVPGEFRVQHLDRTQSALELQNKNNNERSIQRRTRIKKSGRSRLEQDDELIW